MTLQEMYKDLKAKQEKIMSVSEALEVSEKLSNVKRLLTLIGVDVKSLV